MQDLRDLNEDVKSISIHLNTGVRQCKMVSVFVTKPCFSCVKHQGGLGAVALQGKTRLPNLLMGTPFCVGGLCM